MEAKMSLGYEKSKAMLETGLLSDCQFEVQVKGGEPQVCTNPYVNKIISDMLQL